jgi:hypothetical protein
MNAVEIEEAISELASQPYDAAEFLFSFLMAFGNKPTTIARLRAREWFLVPLSAIDEAVRRIKDATITEYLYSPKAADLTKLKNQRS